jgi:hypothetical protein
MAFRCAWVILGANKPLFVLFTSSMALGSGLELSVLIAIPCDRASKWAMVPRYKMNKQISFFMMFVFKAKN